MEHLGVLQVVFDFFNKLLSREFEVDSGVEIDMVKVVVFGCFKVLLDGGHEDAIRIDDLEGQELEAAVFLDLWHLLGEVELLCNVAPCFDASQDGSLSDEGN